jgi:microcystin-dependent protein
MSTTEPYLGEVFLFAGTFAPLGYAKCDGALLPISENDALFALIGTTYGGDGQTTFALPDLRGRVPVHQGVGPSGINYQIGESAGAESVTLSQNHLPAHTHIAKGALTANQVTPANGYWSTDPLGNTAAYSTQAGNALMAADALDPVGGNQPHDNMQPYLGVNYIIALYGIFPPRN